MINEFKQIYDCPDCKTEFEKGDIVRCMMDAMSIVDARFDCGRRNEEIGIVTNIMFYKDLQRSGMAVVICELEIYWAQSDITTFHLDRYIQKIT